MSSETAKLRAAASRVRNLLIRCNDVADQLDGIPRRSDATQLKSFAHTLERMYKRLSDDADLARDNRGARSASEGT